MAVKPVFDEQGFLCVLERELRDSAFLPSVESSQVMVLDREPEPEDGELIALCPPSVVLVPLPFEPDYGLGGNVVVMYRVMAFCVGETWDAESLADSFTDRKEGGAKIRREFADAVQRLGPNLDGKFAPLGGESISWVLPREAESPIKFQSSEGEDMSAAGQIVEWLVSFGGK